MNLSLSALDILATYFIRIAAAYLICLALARLPRQPHFRFTLWFSFLFGAGIYWLFLLAQMVGTIPVGNLAIGGEASAVAPGSAGLMSWELPAQWGGHVAAVVAALPWAYAAGLALMLFSMARKRVQLQQVLRRSFPASPRLEGILDELCDRLRVRPCRMMVLTGLTSPATAYSWRPRILVPETLELYLDRAQLGDVLCHELMHVKRRDYFWGSVSELVRCLLFFHPAIWLALRRLHRERELACDDAVVRQLADRRPDYAECLTRLARVRLAEERTSLAISFATSGSFLSVRVRMLLAEPHRQPLWKRGLALAGGMTLLAGFASLCPALAVVLQFIPPAVAPAVHSELRHQNRQFRRGSSRPLRRAELISTTAHLPNPFEVEREPVPVPIPPPTLALPSLNSTNDESLFATPQSQVSASLESAAAASPPASSVPASDEIPPAKTKTKRHTVVLPSWRRAAIITAIALGRGAVGGGGGQQGENFRSSPTLK